MAITNVEAVTFCNQRVRVMADLLARAYYLSKIVANEWNANAMASLIPNTSEVVNDGSAVDGRHEITGADATAIVTRCNELIADMEATSNAKLNTILAVAVNGVSA